MKKLCNSLKADGICRPWVKFLMAMKLIVIFSLILISPVLAVKSYSQKTNLDLKMQNTTVREVLKAIEDNSDYYFLYNREFIDVDRKVDISVTNMNVKGILDKLFEGEDVECLFKDRQIVLSPKISIDDVNSNQTQNISGKVTDSSGTPLPGVTVVIKGTTQGTITDPEGNYSISNVSSDATLVFSFVGMATQIIPVEGKSSIDILMEEDAIGIEEVVAVGYGTQVRREVTGSISSFDEESFSDNTNSNVEQMLLGKAPGIQVMQTSGEPGGGMNLNIRGTGSINAGSSPLFVIDGMPIDNSVSDDNNKHVAKRNPIGFLNPDDIQSIDVLKDASATAIYGSRGANGVIMITTKSGSKGGVKVDYNSQFGLNWVSNRLDLLGAEEYKNGINSLIDAGGGAESERVEDYTGTGTDWQDVIYNEPAFNMNNNIGASWGNEKTNYFISLNNTREEGLVKDTEFDRSTMRLNVNHRGEKISFGASTTISYIKDTYGYTGFDQNSATGPIKAARLYDPTSPIKDENGNYVASSFFVIDNPVVTIKGNHIKGNRYRSLGSAFLEYSITSNLSAKVNFGADISNIDKRIYQDRSTIQGGQVGGIANAYNTTKTNYLIEGSVDYKRIFKEHSIKVLLGATTQRFGTDYTQQNGTGFPSDATFAYNFGLADRSTVTVSSNKYANRLLSYLGRINYKLLDKYLLTASLRADGSSRFGSGNRFGLFPSVSTGWLIDQEDFMENSIFGTLKLRASWGKTGNQDIGNYLALSTYGQGGTYVVDEEFVIGLDPSRIANSELKWETTTQTDIGIDYALLKNRISGSVAWYRKLTDDMLLYLPIPSSTGFGNRMVNIGSMVNKGFEFSINTYNVDSRNFDWNTNFNFSTIKNEVIDLGELEQIQAGGFPPSPTSTAIIKEGEPLMSFYGYKIEGIWQTDDDFSNAPTGTKPGYLKIKDTDGEEGITPADRIILGNSFPKFQWGMTNDFSYKNFNLNVMITGVHGVSMINGNLMEQYFPLQGIRVNRYREPFLNRWTPDNPTNDQPSFLNMSQRAYATNDRTVVDGSYIKLQSVRLSYDIPSRLYKDKLRNVAVYMSGLNLLTLSDYNGYDPALNPSGNSNTRIDWNGYPSAKTIILGINVGF
ncbi:TonB-dependent receptor [Sunxiuqinia sp. A32]|uniref:TonB-dependent receptor n=1 Tax=Sunxiuqinia sp. A32 TaxID=3461496 RepID=UPI0040455F4B